MQKLWLLFVFAYENIAPMNTLEHIRIGLGLTYEGLGAKIGVKRHVAWDHCRTDAIPAEAAIRYSAALGIPLEQLRPDLPPPVVGTSPTPPSCPAEVGA